MASPTTITISYVTTFTNGVPTANATATVPVPTGIDWTQHVRNIYHAGGFTFVSAAGVNTFIPTNQIISITSP